MHFLVSCRGSKSHAKTGLLTLIHNEQEAELYFQQGQLTSISLKKGPVLGERLVQAGIISQDALQEALLTLLTKDSTLATKNHGDALIAQTLLRLGKLRHEQLNAWMIREAIEILRNLLIWSESDVYFTEGVTAPPDRLILNYRVTSLISSLSDENAISNPSHGIPRNLEEERHQLFPLQLQFLPLFSRTCKQVARTHPIREYQLILFLVLLKHQHLV